ncbi:hypothetical protein BD626DRAFT_156745 [Schizophyllum amplum]|uniref:Uncharacterized protein n=1 Tax=Schizophyllum amplum TaxID=97359 RepID=A0A550C322_9AGAR|nr:hypothetical protein BD626DRAFT_156745 [Auriculariopsis ampla]
MWLCVDAPFPKRTVAFVSFREARRCYEKKMPAGRSPRRNVASAARLDPFGCRSHRCFLSRAIAEIWRAAFTASLIRQRLLTDGFTLIQRSISFRGCHPASRTWPIQISRQASANLARRTRASYAFNASRWRDGLSPAPSSNRERPSDVLAQGCRMQAYAGRGVPAPPPIATQKQEFCAHGRCANLTLHRALSLLAFLAGKVPRRDTFIRQVTARHGNTRKRVSRTDVPQRRSRYLRIDERWCRCSTDTDKSSWRHPGAPERGPTYAAHRKASSYGLTLEFGVRCQ